MATIKTAIALYDGVTAPLQSMHRAMNIVLNSFEAMQRVSGNSVDASAIREARDELARAGTAFDAIEESVRESGKQQDKFNRKIQEGASSAGGLWNKLKGVAAAVGGLAAAKKIIGISDELAGTRARLNLLVDDGGSVSELEQKIMASAQRSRSAYFDTASAVAKLGLNAGAAFDGDMDQVIAFMEQVNKQFVIGGATAQEQSNAMVQLTQAMAAGALRGEELNSILDGAPGIARAIEQYMGAAEGSIKQYAEQGLVTAEVVKNALFSMADETNAKFESMPKTWDQIWISMQNRALSIFAPILTRINQIANSEQFTKVTDGIIGGLAAVAAIASSVFGMLTNGAAWVIDNWSWLSPVILGVAAALGIYYGAQAAANAVGLISNGIHAAMAAGKMMQLALTGSLTAATAAQTASQYGLNAAMYACPLVWIIVLIITLVALFYAAVAAVNHFAGTSVSATGLIMGAFAAVGAFLWNLLLSCLEFVIGVLEYLINPFINFANFIGNVFENPVSSIIYLFQGMADTVLGILQKIASALDFVFGSNMADAVQGWRDGLKQRADAMVAEYAPNENYREIINTLDFSVSDMGLERIAYGDAFDAGYSFGEGIDDKVSSLFDFSAADSLGAGDSLSAYGIGNTLDGIYANTGDTAASTAAMGDALDIAEEDLAYLRDIAEREAINRFTTAKITVEQQNTNYISKDTDVDGIMDAWADDFAARLDISGEGVHE